MLQAKKHIDKGERELPELQSALMEVMNGGCLMLRNLDPDPNPNPNWLRNLDPDSDGR